MRTLSPVEKQNYLLSFYAIREDKEFIHLHMENTHLIPYIKIIKPQEMINNKTNSSITCEDSYENTPDKKEYIANDTPRQEEGSITRI
jgi:hypothetical protein